MTKPKTRPTKTQVQAAREALAAMLKGPLTRERCFGRKHDPDKKIDPIFRGMLRATSLRFATPRVRIPNLPPPAFVIRHLRGRGAKISGVSPRTAAR
jgi:hypothetical protein